MGSGAPRLAFSERGNVAQSEVGETVALGAHIELVNPAVMLVIGAQEGLECSGGAIIGEQIQTDTPLVAIRSIDSGIRHDHTRRSAAIPLLEVGLGGPPRIRPYNGSGGETCGEGGRFGFTVLIEHQKRQGVPLSNQCPVVGHDAPGLIQFVPGQGRGGVAFFRVIRTPIPSNSIEEAPWIGPVHGSDHALIVEFDFLSAHPDLHASSSIPGPPGFTDPNGPLGLSGGATEGADVLCTESEIKLIPAAVEGEPGPLDGDQTGVCS